MLQIRSKNESTTTDSSRKTNLVSSSREGKWMLGIDIGSEATPQIRKWMQGKDSSSQHVIYPSPQWQPLSETHNIKLKKLHQNLSLYEALFSFSMPVTNACRDRQHLRDVTWLSYQYCCYFLSFPSSSKKCRVPPNHLLVTVAIMWSSSRVYWFGQCEGPSGLRNRVPEEQGLGRGWGWGPSTL